MECKQNSKLNSKKVNVNQDKTVKRSNTSSSVKKKKKNNVNTNTVKKPITRNETLKDGEHCGDSLEIEGVQLRTPREEDAYQVEKTESNGERDEIKGDNFNEGNSAVNEEKPESVDINDKSVSSISLEETVSTALSHVTLKPKNNFQRTNKLKGSNPRIINNTQQQGARNAKKLNSDSKTSIYSSSSNSRLKNESLRWENECDDQEEEDERIRVYKINRRKRYLAAAQAKGLGWVANYASNGSPMSEDSGIEMRERETNVYSLKDTHKSVNDFSTLQTLGPTHSNLNTSVTVDC